MKVTAKAAEQTKKKEWKPVLSFVSYPEPNGHRQIVEDSFEFHLGCDMEEMRRDYPSHFTDPHNVCRAILLYQYFRLKFIAFGDPHWEFIAEQDLPARIPDNQGVDFKLWVEFPDDSKKPL